MARPMPVLPEVGSMMVPPGCSAPLALGVLDHGQRDAVLDRAAGIAALGLDPDLLAPGPNRRLMRTCGVLPMVSQDVVGFHSGLLIGWVLAHSGAVAVPLRAYGYLWRR
jgi:hypothetical protein